MIHASDVMPIWPSDETRRSRGAVFYFRGDVCARLPWSFREAQKINHRVSTLLGSNFTNARSRMQIGGKARNGGRVHACGTINDVIEVAGWHVRE